MNKTVSNSSKQCLISATTAILILVLHPRDSKLPIFKKNCDSSLCLLQLDTAKGLLLDKILMKGLQMAAKIALNSC